MSDSQNRDPFAELIGPDGKGPLWRSGALIDVPTVASYNHRSREAARAEIVKDRQPPARPREEVVADLAAQRAEAEAFIAKADRVLAPGRSPSSAQVDAILADEANQFGVEDEGEYWDEAA